MIRFEKSKMRVGQTYNVLTLQNKSRLADGDFRDINATTDSNQISTQLQQNTNIRSLKATKNFSGIREGRYL